TASLVVWSAGERVERSALLIWLDALGLAAYAVIGAAKALAFHVDPVVATAMGVLTACFGGVIRDVLAGQPSGFVKREVSGSAALVVAELFVLLAVFRVEPLWAGLIGAVAGFALRAGAIHYGWRLMAFGERRAK